MRSASVPSVSHVRDLPAEALMNADFSDTELNVARLLVERADALVIATPIYKAAYSGLLKAFLDILPQDGLDGKIILPLATAGSRRTCWHSIMPCALC
jgi:FMN reductase